ncbi:hypothetical protein DXV75_06625 [Alteromonas aestuariivivens]|uniref:Pilus assembly protein PilP n=1 Tax=Alteromonas aestuariivivens TaxID=1938339 RepID=A0A3D8M9G1_9ALTE|nr:hypothetical protein [Alteromonas aestuariivivens]RDV26657.1 hypothetical protein DXV75_06625 [Alteromonas aestuariivivens]
MKYKALLVCCGLTWCVPAMLNAATLEQSLSQCSAENDSLKRLLCYDRLAESLNQNQLQLQPSKGSENPPVVAVPPKTEAQVNSPKVASSGQEIAFGLEHKQAPKVDQDERLYGKITKLSETPYDKYIITLDNGTVWTQTDSSPLRLKVGDQVYVERGMLGAFYLSTDKVKRRIKVVREE